MLIEVGEVIHVLMRRYFDGQPKRHFLGKITQIEGMCVRARGYTFMTGTSEPGFRKQDTIGERLISLHDDSTIVTVMPSGFDVERATYSMRSGFVVVTDGKHEAELDETAGLR